MLEDVFATIRTLKRRCTSI